MIDTTLMTPQERESYRRYDDQRRTRLARLVASVCCGVALLVAFTLTLYLLLQLQALSSFTLITTLMVWLDLGCYSLGIIAARRGHPTLTALCVCGGLLSTIIVLQGEALVAATAAPSTSSFLLLFALPLVVVVAGILGNIPFLITITTVLALGGSAVLVFTGQTFLLIVLYEIVLIMPGALMVVFQQGYQRTLRELGDVRIAYERASALDDLKNQFIINVNHELRNPVMAMMGHLDILDMSLTSAPPERLQKAVRGAIRASENLRTLLASILDANRMEQSIGDFTPEAVLFVQALQAAIQLIDPKEGSLHERELRVQASEKLSIWGEPVRLQQILTNLVSNALKYSAPGTPIEVRARVVVESGAASSRRKHAAPGTRKKMVEITVRDWGLGIPTKQIPLLFQRFVRLPRDLASTVVGNGLGLYVCRVCAEAMGGRVWVESSGVEGEGAVFHVLLPFPPAPDHAGD
ncbi:MAG TPA: HAMP domain-containing sensor histidine kinase [Ktedonobacterales bacterium]|nr:HAMP domain-containing sensor histidine kinase [Ktedonobacterales bacterium]